ncbi:MAG: hypothetical protein QMD04_14780 [Anaerolineales bacterium]|nr:hypothetical protein [Anaerolineales bacterium]
MPDCVKTILSTVRDCGAAVQPQPAKPTIPARRRLSYWVAAAFVLLLSICGMVVAFVLLSMNADGTNPRNLTNNPADDVGPAWSPDGRFIAFVSTRGGIFSGSIEERARALLRYIRFIIDTIRYGIAEIPANAEIYVMDANGANQCNLTEEYGGYIIAGATNSFGAGEDDFYLIETDAEGGVGERNR